MQNNKDKKVKGNETMAGKYLDPKADLTFKLVFGEHPDLVMSLLNALLPLEDDGQITSVEYLPSEMVPDNPGKKDSVVDVRCTDQRKRQFIVEMQLYWNEFFQQRVLLNASKAVVRQLDKGVNYKMIQPVYCLNLVNDIGFQSGPDEFYHDYAIVNVEHSDRIIEGLRFVYVELPKFKPKTIAEKKMAVLWLRFLTEIDRGTEVAPAELLENELTNKALSIVEKSAMSEAQLDAYEKFWISITDQEGFLEARYTKGIKEGMEKGMKVGMAQGMAEGMAQGMAEGMAQGKDKANRENASLMKADGMAVELIAKYTGLSIEEIEDL